MGLPIVENLSSLHKIVCTMLDAMFVKLELVPPTRDERRWGNVTADGTAEHISESCKHACVPRQSTIFCVSNRETEKEMRDNVESKQSRKQFHKITIRCS